MGKGAQTVFRVMAALSLVVLVGLVAVDAWSAHEADQAVNAARAAAEAAGEAQVAELLADAAAYNARLAGDDAAPAPARAYADQLRLEAEPVMAYVEAPAASLRLPVYWGTGEAELMAGAGHWEGSSLPVGGASARCVLMAHSGMSAARMFDDIRLLAEGDAVTVWTLGRPHEYRVCGSEVVEPADVPKRMGVQKGRDLLTLVTCTPYGQNTHRLLVHAERVESSNDAAPASAAGAFPRFGLRALAVAAAIAAALAAGIAAALLRRGRRRVARARK